MIDWKKKFIIIWTGQLFSILSSSIAQFAVVLWISLETGSAEVLSYATIAALLPQALLGPFAGVFVDRWSRKWTMIGADSFVALCSGIIALLFYLDVVELWQIYILLMFRSIGGAFHAPAMKSSIPLLAPESELMRIAAVNQAIQSVCSIGGPALGAILLLSFDMSMVMLLDVAGAFIACTSLLFVFIPNPKKELLSAKGVMNDMAEGFKVILENRGISWVMATEVLITFFVLPIVALMPLMTLQNFSGTAYQVSLIEVLFGIGMLIGGILLGIWNPKIRKIFLIVSSYFFLGFTLALSGLLPSDGYMIFAILTVVQGIVIPFYSGPFTSLLQTQFKPNYLGRVFALFDSVSLFPSIIGLLVTSFMADSLGIANIFLYCGIAIVLTTVLMLCIPSVRNLGKDGF
ncbi:MFS transporter, DHA3 family, macrolide efflux protein [Bacteroides faecichinchillae]|uniref:MFS transporter, DHA3 family, macrolide efflux protein n=1 Tax=Bacteroides faecichinchillae TaxID=871325 RepID=A0A1M5E2L4_9BACE|nr:MFS transporter [Bacteroides faecichinchillae]THG63968.1 MFS transporter [Bacteroides faecichinchillae]SHF73469.1 MFS transporter, DHA3 family, macrolide efflux protein [Bacteroides faecichinchillae]